MAVTYSAGLATGIAVPVVLTEATAGTIGTLAAGMSTGGGIAVGATAAVGIFAVGVGAGVLVAGEEIESLPHEFISNNAHALLGEEGVIEDIL